MAMYLSSILVLSLLIILPDLWFYLKMKKHRFYRWLRFSALVPGILFIMSFFYIRYGLRYNDNYLLTSRISWIFVILALIYTPKIIYIIFYYINRLFNRVFGKRTRKAWPSWARSPRASACPAGAWAGPWPMPI